MINDFSYFIEPMMQITKCSQIPGNENVQRDWKTRDKGDTIAADINSIVASDWM